MLSDRFMLGFLGERKKQENPTILYTFVIGSNTIHVRLGADEDWRKILLLMFWANDLACSRDMMSSPTVTVLQAFPGNRGQTLYEGTLDELATSMGQF